MGYYDIERGREFDSYYQEAVDKMRQMHDRYGMREAKSKAPIVILEPTKSKPPCAVCGNLFTVKNEGDDCCRLCVKLAKQGLTRRDYEEEKYIANLETARRIVKSPFLHGEFKVRTAQRMIDRGENDERQMGKQLLLCTYGR